MAAERDELKALVDSMRSKSTGMGRLFSLQRRNTRKNKKEWEEERREEKRREEKRREEKRREEKRREEKGGKELKQNYREKRDVTVIVTLNNVTSLSV